LHCGNSAGTRDLARHEAQHVEFWDIMATLAEHELAEARRWEEIDWARVWGDAPPPHLQRRKAGWHTSINADVVNADGWRRVSQLTVRHPAPPSTSTSPRNRHVTAACSPPWPPRPIFLAHFLHPPGGSLHHSVPESCSLLKCWASACTVQP